MSSERSLKSLSSLHYATRIAVLMRIATLRAPFYTMQCCLSVFRKRVTYFDHRW